MKKNNTQLTAAACLNSEFQNVSLCYIFRQRIHFVNAYIYTELFMRLTGCTVYAMVK